MSIGAAHPAVPADWPHADASREVSAGGVCWHVQHPAAPDRPPGAPRVLCLHGTGASAHSFRNFARALLPWADPLLVDLPGQGFSSALPPSQSTTAGFATAVDHLLRQLDFRPDVVVGHSAGAAVALRLARLDAHRDVPVVAVNGALAPLGGAAGRMFAPLAQLVSERAFVVRMVTRRAQRRGAVAKLLGGTGSRCTPEDLALYRRLLVDASHVAGTFRMMANWDLPHLAEMLEGHDGPVHLVEGGNDLTLSPAYRASVRRLLPHASVTTLPALGHLAHEEAPAEIAAILREWLAGAPGGAPSGACDTVPGTVCEGGTEGHDAGGPEEFERS